MRAARTDSNQVAIVSALRKLGATVLHLHTIGKGCPDIIVGHQGINVLMEIKDSAKPPSARKLTADEQKFHDAWRGQVAIVESVDQAVSHIMQNQKEPA